MSTFGCHAQVQAEDWVVTYGYRVRVAGETEGWLLRPGCHCIGRSRSCSVQIDDVTVSRRHVEIEILAEGGVVVRDLDSTNGSWLGERRIHHAAVTGDFDLRIGAIELEFDLQRDVRESTSAGGLKAEDGRQATHTPTGVTTAMEPMR
jgi:predicted component of type VI protein secretion system